MSATFAAIGFFGSIGLYIFTKNFKLSLGVFYFFAMEFLQVVQYIYIAPDLKSPICDTDVNQMLTFLGWLHICFQPFFCHLIVEALVQKEWNKERFTLLRRLTIIGGFLLLARHFLASVPGYSLNGATPTEWMRGEKLCTFQGRLHLAWSIPLADVTYIIPGVSLHSFLMFAPFLAMYDEKGILIQGIILFLTGPSLAGYITQNLMEQASIWCFFSISQIIVLLFSHFVLGINSDASKTTKSKTK